MNKSYGFKGMVVLALLAILAMTSGCASDKIVSGTSISAVDAAPIQQESLPETRVGDLSFQVTSLRVSEDRKFSFTSWATISMTIRNNGKTPIALNYVWEKSRLVNVHGYVWHDNNDRAVIGLPVELDRSASVKSVIEPGSELNATIPLYYENLNPGQTAGDSFNLKAEFSSYQDAGEGRLKKLGTYHVSFIGLHKSPLQTAVNEAASNPDKNTRADTSPQPELLPEVHVGELGFKVTSLRVSRDDRVIGGFGSNANISMTITNDGNTPVALDYVKGKASFVNEYGYYWSDHNEDQAIVGLPTATANSAGVNVVIKPGSELHVTLTLFYETLNGKQTVGDNFNFEAEFRSYQNMGEGEVKQLRTYPVSFVGLQQSSLQDDAKQGLQDFGDSLKKGFGGLFGR